MVDRVDSGTPSEKIGSQLYLDYFHHCDAWRVPTPAEMVIIRYLSILLPFIIYFTFLGAGSVLNFLKRRLHFLGGTALVKVGSILLLAQILFTNMRGNSINFTLSNHG